MSSSHLKNIPLKLFRSFLEEQGCVCNRTKGGHEHWSRKDLLRPITLQTHVDPIPEFIVRNTFKQLGLKKEDFTNWI
jgi:predicted RNA binding protein YcfA (HicA-like mRNA interferase family)